MDDDEGEVTGGVYVVEKTLQRLEPARGSPYANYGKGLLPPNRFWRHDPILYEFCRGLWWRSSSCPVNGAYATLPLVASS